MRQLPLSVLCKNLLRRLPDDVTVWKPILNIDKVGVQVPVSLPSVRSRALAVAMLLIGSLLIAAPGFVDRAEAAHVQCGEVITTSGVNITLDSDVGPCVTDGIIIQADNVTLNLNGFDVIGDDNPATDNVGIRINGTQNQVVDCTQPFSSTPPCSPGRQDSAVREFSIGILITGGSSNEVCRITVSRNIGLGLQGDGIVVLNSNSNTIANNTVELNGQYSGITLLGDSDGNKVGTPINPDFDGASLRTSCDGGNTVRANNVNAQSIGIRLEPDPVAHPNSNTVENNVVTLSQLDGIAHLFPAPTYTGSTSNTIRSNTVTNNGFTVAPRRGDGIRLNGNLRLREVGANNTVVEDNIVRDNAAHGISVNSQNNNIKHNEVMGNGIGSPGATPQPDVEFGHGIHIRNDKNTVNQHNHVMGNYGDGINLTNGATNNNIKQNLIMNHPTGDGINTEVGALGNNIMNNESTGNGVLPLHFDLSDHNPNADPVPPCETNTWQSNVEITKNQPCID